MTESGSHERVLHPTDGSDCAAEAIRHAIVLTDATMPSSVYHAIVARTAIGVAGAPKNMQGAPFGGPTNLFSGPGADEIAKLAPGSSIQDHAYYQDWGYWDKHLKHNYGKYGELGGMNYWDSPSMYTGKPLSTTSPMQCSTSLGHFHCDLTLNGQVFHARLGLKSISPI